MSYFKNVQSLTIADLTAAAPNSEKFEKLIMDYQKSVFSALNRCLLDGYYCKTLDFQTDFQLFKQECEFSLASYRESLESNSGQFFHHYFSTSYIEYISKHLTSFQQFYEQVHSKIQFRSDEFFINFSINEDISSFGLFYDRTGLSAYDTFSQFEIIYKCNLFIAHCDHFLTIENFEYVKKLDEIIEHLIQFTSPSLKRLTYKARYLRYKIVLRQALQEKDLSNRKPFLIIDGKKSRLNPQSNFNDLSTYFGDWLNHLSNHYGLTVSHKEVITDKFNNLENKRGRISSIQELHLQIKYFKDISFEAKPLKNLISEIDDIAEKENESDFNKYARTVYSTYLINNYFSLLCEKKQANQNLIPQEYENCISRLDKLETKNYFIHSKYIEFILWELEKEFKELVDSDNLISKLSNFKDKLTACETLIEEYKKNILWVKENYNYVFQLPFEECLIDIDDEKLFVFSSFVLPIDRTEMERTFFSNEKKFEALKTASFTFNSLTSLYQSYKDLKKENERKESKNIEILAVFVAIVTFTAGVIPGFKFIDNGVEAIFFTLALGISMAAFGLTLFSVSKNKSDWCANLRHLGIFIVFSAIVWYGAYRFFNSDFVNYKERIMKEKILKEFEDSNSQSQSSK
jgi:hypothetical protein